MSHDLEPPPSLLELVKDNPEADAAWKKWLNNLREWALENMSKDFFFEVTQGNENGYSSVHKFGGNSTIPNGSERDVWEPGSGDLTYLTTAQTVHLISSVAGDNQASITGARSVYIEGLDANFDVQSEVVNMHATDGTIASGSTTNTYIRIYRAYVEDAGAYGVTNLGDIDVVEDGASTTQCRVPASFGQSVMSHYTVPADKTGYIKRISITVDTGKDVDVEMKIRKEADVTAAPTSAWRTLHHWHGIGTPLEEVFYHSLDISEKTDIKFIGEGNGGTAEVEVDYDIILVDN